MEYVNKKFKRGELYKLKHLDMEVGKRYRDFTCESNCIIFCPKEDIITNEATSIPCMFLITFSRKLRFEGSNGELVTSFRPNNTECVPIDKNDIAMLINLFKNNWLRLVGNVYLKDILTHIKKYY